MHLLIDMEKGDIIVGVNKDEQIITIDVRNGSITLGYNDTNLLSHIKTIKEGEKGIFNDQTRNLEIK
jgi:hypothetical protein